MKLHAHRSLWFFIAIFSVGLSGCASPPLYPDTPADREMISTEGAVVASLTGNTAQVQSFDAIWLEALESESKHVLRRISLQSNASTSVYVGLLPAGRYQVTRLDAGQKYLEISDVGQKAMGQVLVQAGKTADIGRIIAASNGLKLLVGRSALVTENSKLISRTNSDQWDALPKPFLTGWATPKSEKDVAEKLALLFPVGVTNLVHLSDGSVVTGSRMGNLLTRDVSGKWNREHIGVLDTIRWITKDPTSAGDLLLVGELNLIARRPAGSKTFEFISSGDLPIGNILFLNRTGNTWYLGHDAGEELTIYRSNTLDNGKWEVLRSTSIKFSNWSGANMAWIWPTNDGFGFATSKGELSFFNHANGEWKSVDAPGKRIASIAPHSDGNIGLLTSPGGGFGGIFSGTYLSMDSGENWIKTKSPIKIKVSPPLSLKSGRIIEHGGALGKDQVFASDDQAESWKVISRDKISPYAALYEIPSIGIFATTFAFDMVSIAMSDDDGATWKTEFHSLQSPSKTAIETKSE